jgi:23S rRNA pseudouridine1911/1915/1917 synthase
MRKIKVSGQIALDGRPARLRDKGTLGQILTVAFPEESSYFEPEDIPLDVVYEDGDLIVVNKPKGMVVHPAAGNADGTLVNGLLYHCGALSNINGVERPGIVHRIDKETSGLLIAAKNDFAHRSLSAQLKDRSLSREYETVVRGSMRDEAGTIDAPIGRHPTERKKMAVTEKNSRPAVTHYEVLARYPGYTHLRCKLETGRTHQIRVHLAYAGHPVLGDAVYGMKKPDLGQTSQCLHAKAIRFLHPRTGEAMRFETALPAYFQEVLDKLNKMAGNG